MAALYLILHQSLPLEDGMFVIVIPVINNDIFLQPTLFNLSNDTLQMQEYLVNVIESLNVCNFLLVTKYLSVFNILSTFSGHKLHQILWINLLYFHYLSSMFSIVPECCLSQALIYKTCISSELQRTRIRSQNELREKMWSSSGPHSLVGYLQYHNKL